MAPKTMLLAAALCAVALAGCTAGDDSGGSSDGDSSTDGVGVGGNVTAGNTTLSGSLTATGTNSTGNGTTNGTSSAPMTASVSLEGNEFVNDTVTILAGGTVTWTHNDGSTSHTVTADDGSFDSSPGCSSTLPPLPPTGDCMTQGETFSTTFATAGTYAYHCKLHSGMVGEVVVVEP